MICPKCGAQVIDGSTFCIKCGCNMKETSVPVFENNNTVPNSINLGTQINSVPENNVVQNINIEGSTLQREPIVNEVNNINISFVDYLLIILSVLIKPFTTLKNELNKFNTFKNSLFLSLIVSGSMTIINFIKNILAVIKVKEFDIISQSYKSTLSFDRMKDLDFVELIGKNLLIYIGIIFAIAVVYYLASLVVKKQVSFSKLLGISSLCVIPFSLSYFILSPLLSIISFKLSLPIILIGLVYSIIIMYEGINNEINIEEDKKYYFNLVCISILAIAAYYLYMNMFMSSVTNGIGDILDLFN